MYSKGERKENVMSKKDRDEHLWRINITGAPDQTTQVTGPWMRKFLSIGGSQIKTYHSEDILLVGERFQSARGLPLVHYASRSVSRCDSKKK